MTREQLISEIKRKRSFLCVGLDSDLNKIPNHLLSTDNPLLEFNKAIIDATKDYCVAYKPNIAFYEKLGSKGWDLLEQTLAYIPSEIFTIADAKRGDIGNTAKMYASTFYETYDFDSVTVAPYMGEDSIRPFLDFKSKWAIVLGLTSNNGAFDFQYLSVNNRCLFEEVIEKTASYGSNSNLMFVVGATKAKDLSKVRKVAPTHFLLVPGVGAQGGDLDEVCKHGLIEDVGLLVNSSRGIIYASSDTDFAQKAGEAAHSIQQQMSTILSRANI